MVSNGLPTLLMRESIWFEAPRYEEAERQYHEFCARERALANPSVVKPTSGGKPTSVVNPTSCGMSKSSLACEIAYARQKIQNFLKSGDVKTAYTDVSSLLGRIENLEKEKNEMNNQLENLYSKYDEVLSKLSSMEKVLHGLTSPEGKKANETVQNGPPGEDEDLDLFGSDEEDEDATQLKEERLKAYADKKAKKPALVAKSSVILDVKPWDDETDMKAMEKAVREIKLDGLVWGASKLVPLAYGIKKLQIVAVVEDEKVSIDWLQETIQDIEDLVQSVDIAAFNKL